ncbi:hypothetical protein AAY473_005935 [Plecturocebus cupreus]
MELYLNQHLSSTGPEITGHFPRLAIDGRGVAQSSRGHCPTAVGTLGSQGRQITSDREFKTSLTNIKKPCLH